MWRGVYRDVRRFLKNCPGCIKNGRAHQGAVEVQPGRLTPAGPNRVWQIDALGPMTKDALGQAYAVVIIDCFSRYVWVYPVVDLTAHEVAYELNAIMAREGIPDVLHSDGGQPFASKAWEQLSLWFGHEQRFSPAHHPQSTGLAERANKMVMDKLRFLVMDGERKTDWSLYLPWAARAVNTTLSSAHGFTPEEVHYGRQSCAARRRGFQLPAGEPVQIEPVANEDVNVHLEAQRQAFLNVQRRMEEWLKVVQAPKTPLLHLMPIQVGDLVLVEPDPSQKFRRSKLSTLREGPLKVVELMHHDQVKLQLPYDVQPKIVHRDRLIRVRPDIHYNEERLAHMAKLDTELFDVERILDHRGTLQNEDLMLHVQWKGYPLEEATWESYHRDPFLQETDAVREYLASHPELLPPAMGKRRRQRRR